MLSQLNQSAFEPALIPSRLKKLDEEWDLERVLEMNASALAFIGTALGGGNQPLVPDYSAPGYSLSVSARAAGMVPAAPHPQIHRISDDT